MMFSHGPLSRFSGYQHYHLRLALQLIRFRITFIGQVCVCGTHKDFEFNFKNTKHAFSCCHPIPDLLLKQSIKFKMLIFNAKRQVSPSCNIYKALSIAARLLQSATAGHLIIHLPGINPPEVFLSSTFICPLLLS